MTTEEPKSNDSTAIEPRSEEGWTVTIPHEVGVDIDRRIQKTRFESVDEYVSFALESLLKNLEDEPDVTAPKGDSTVCDAGRADGDTEHVDDDTERSEAVADRLESLGYL